MKTSADNALQNEDMIELRIAARAENVALARLTLSGVAAAAGVPPDVVADLKLAVSEACTNAVQHAYAGGGANEREEQVVLRFIVAERKLLVQVEDEGAGFALVTRGSWEDGERAGRGLGMGLTIVRSVTDDLQIESGGKGSRVAFSKKF